MRVLIDAGADTEAKDDVRRRVAIACCVFTNRRCLPLLHIHLTPTIQCAMSFSSLFPFCARSIIARYYSILCIFVRVATNSDSAGRTDGSDARH